jgi:hypothetical protein
VAEIDHPLRKKLLSNRTFDQTGIIKQLATDLGVAAKVTLETIAYAQLCTTANYDRTTADNSVGNNTGTTTFSAGGLLTAWRTIRTMFDRKSGRPLNIIPDTLITAPGNEWAAKQLLFADTIVRASANNAAEVYGTGQANPIRGVVTRLIVSPFMGTAFGWALMAAKKMFVYQEVDPLQLLIEDVKGNQNSEGYFVYDRIRYRARIWGGVGVRNSHFGYYSDSTTTPAAG